METTENKKIEAYLGFCIRCGRIAFGVDDMEKQKKTFLLIADESLGESSFKTVKKLQEKFGCKLLIGKSGALGGLLHKPAVKAVAIKEKNLAAAVLSAAAARTKLKLIRGGKE